ncbi:PAS domain S-box protein [Altericista sp. CCNU0014]|uniref:PAS domain S-box protein n=1 Tax=Altericista sp. CCNU0014 TaxID=3082949 RepID=UPI00384B2F0E
MRENYIELLQRQRRILKCDGGMGQMGKYGWQNVRGFASRNANGHSMQRSHNIASIGLASLLVGLAVLGTVLYRSITRYNDKSHWVEHTHEVIDTSSALLSHLKDAEIARHEYLQMPNSDDLERFKQSQGSMRKILGQLKQLTRGNPTQQIDLAHIEQLAQKDLKLLQQATDGSDTQQPPAALKTVLQTQDKIWAKEIRRIALAIQQREELFLVERTKLKQLEADRLFLTLYAIAFLSILLILALALLYWNTIQRQLAQAQTLQEIERSQKSLATVLEGIGEAFISLDQNWNFVYVNRKAGEILRRSPESLIGENIWQEFPEAVDQPVYLAYHRAMKEQKPLQIEEYYQPWNKWFENRIYPSARGIAIFFQDTTERKQTELALRESNHKFRAVFNHTFEYITLLTPDGIVLEMNHGPLDFMKVDYEIVQGKPFWELSAWGDDPDLSQQVRSAIENAAQGQFIRYDISDLKNYWGEPRTFDFSMKPIFDDNATVTYIVAEGRDITDLNRTQKELQLYREHLEALVEQRTTELMEVNAQLQQELLERQRAEAALALSERQYRTLTENSIDVIVRHDRDLNYLFVSNSFNESVGTPEGYWIGKNLADMEFPDELKQCISESCEAVFRSGEVGLMNLTGPTVKGWRNFQCLIVPEFDDNYKVESVLISGRDVTEIKEREAAIQEAERRWRYLLDNVRLVVVGLNQRGETDYVNPFCLEITGYSADEVLGKPWFETFLPKAQQQEVRKAFEELIDLEFHPYYQNSIVTKRGEERIIAWNNTQLRNAQGEVTGSVSIGEDITERFALERMKAEFVSVVSHELRTPITSIQGALNLLTEGLIPVESSRGHEVLTIAADGADRLVNIVNDILDLERLESGKLTLAIVPCQAAYLMTNASELMRVLADRAGVILHATPQPYELMGDGDRLIQVMTNLLSNAIKFSPKGATIWFGVERDNPPDFLQFWVRDEGRGIPPEQLESIFERFHQVDATDSRQKGGTGLGLPICRSIVQQHGGTIWAESAPGRGSCFYFTVPVKSPQIERA